MNRVAIIGAGPSGLVAARFLLAHKMTPTIYEAHSALGGQWNASNPASGVWPSMHTNTARMVTRFSDLDYGEKSPIFPHNQTVLEYLSAYAEQFGIDKFIQYSTALVHLKRLENEWELTLENQDGPFQALFDRVIVATGAYNCSHIPAVDGLEGFSGDANVIHAFDYKDPQVYRNKDVLVAGGNISALEIAQDLAMLGAKSVTTTMRRQRYVMPKLIAGTPVESYGFRRKDALWQETATPEEWAENTKSFILCYGGSPDWYGAPAPDPDVRIAGTTGSQNFLNLVAEGRITCKPWVSKISGNSVTFEDGSRAEFDGIIFGTGYQFDLPYLSDDLREELMAGSQPLNLVERTFLPSNYSLAFLGHWSQIGPYLPVLEMQARYLAYTWSGLIDPTEPNSNMTQNVGGNPSETYYHLLAIQFARLANCDPSALHDPETAAILDDNAVTALSFRLLGQDQLPNARDQIREDAHRFGQKNANASE